MGEMQLNRTRGEIPVVIVRPSIIMSTYKEPFPGWIQGNSFRTLMGPRLLLIFAFLSLALVASHVALPSIFNWNSMLPNTPMHKAIKDLLRPGTIASVSFRW